MEVVPIPEPLQEPDCVFSREEYLAYRKSTSESVNPNIHGIFLRKPSYIPVNYLTQCCLNTWQLAGFMSYMSNPHMLCP